ncbi:MAG: hypothetical protein J0H01_22460 [Rhizobiales bacterium]|nr:hypothetical protein [Hyphomicrobiales bacterium]
MAKGALFVGWGALIPGREKVAPGVLDEALAFLQGKRQRAEIDGFDVALLEPHGGDLEGFVLVKGDKDVLARLRVEEAFLRIIVGVQLVHQRVGVVWAHMGAEMPPLFALWDQQEEKLLAS